MVGQVRFEKTKWYPRPHNSRYSYAHGLETGLGNNATIIPIAAYDEGLGSPSAYEANPEHSLFAETDAANCFVDSRVDNIITQITFSLTKAALETDKLPAVKVAFMPIFMSFLEDYTAFDEKSTYTIAQQIEMQTESTDRQGYPLYSGAANKMVEKFTGSATMPTTHLGLTTNQILEGVAFQPGVFYDALHYFTTAGKLKSVQGGLKFLTLTKNRPVAKIQIKLRSKTKRMNPYTFFGVLTYVPPADSTHQYSPAADTTNVNHVWVDTQTRYNEWNQDFNFKKV